MEWSEVGLEVFSAYGRGEYEKALQVVATARPEFPDRDSRLTFWEACLSSMAGDPERAIDVLESGLERGLAWHPNMLSDSDLEPARQLDRWDQFVERSGALISATVGERPEPLVRHVERPSGTLIALHGAGEIPGKFFAEWDAASPPGWRILAPAGDVPTSTGEWAWPFDLSTDSLTESLREFELTPPVVLTGYSQGARLAAKVAWDGLVEAAGMILSAAALAPEVWEDSNQVPVPLFAVVGTDDLAYEPSLVTSRLLQDAGVPVHLDVRDGLGHVPPPDLEAVMRRGLDWIQEQSPS